MQNGGLTANKLVLDKYRLSFSLGCLIHNGTFVVGLGLQVAYTATIFCLGYPHPTCNVQLSYQRIGYMRSTAIHALDYPHPALQTFTSTLPRTAVIPRTFPAPRAPHFTRTPSNNIQK